MVKAERPRRAALLGAHPDHPLSEIRRLSGRGDGMRRIWAIGMAAGAILAGPALAAPVPPPGEPALFTVFRTVCALHQGDIAAAEAEARRQGFVTVPPSPDEDPASAAMRTVLKRDSTEPPMVVILTRAPPEVVAGAPNAEASLCGVSGLDAGGAVRAAARAWVGLEPSSQEGNHITFLYRQSPVRRLRLADQEDATIKAAIGVSEFRVFDIDPEADGVTLGLMTGLTRPPRP